MPEQTWNPDRYARHAGFVPVNGESLIEWLAPRAGERILDLGCGDGKLTAKLAEAGCSVVGVDASAEQIEVARRLGLDARVADGRRLPFAGEFDAVFSNAALHWMKEPDAVAAGVFRSLKPGGRFVGEMGGAGNVATVRRAVHDELRRRDVDPEPLDPWYFPTPEEYRSRLEAAGFVVGRIELFPKPTQLPTDIAGWLETFAGSFAAALPEPDRAGFFAAVQERVRPALRRPDGTWWLTDYTRLRFAAVRPDDGGT
jgi:SAM-dependent methyltransferase